MTPFTELFLLADEVVRVTIVEKLSLKDLSNLDIALNNHKAVEQCRRWFRNTARDLRSAAQASDLYLDWMQARGIRIATLFLSCNQRPKFLHCLESRNLAASALDYRLPKMYVAINLLSSFRDLSSVSLCAQSDLGELSKWEAFFEKNPNLHTFILHGNWKCCHVHQFFILATTHLRAMTVLFWGHCDGVNDDIITLIAQHWRQLRRLRLRGCSVITDQSLDAIGKHCNKLTSLQLQAKVGCVSVTAVVQLLNCCTQMRTIMLWDCSAVNTTLTAPLNSSFGAQLVTLMLESSTARLSRENEVALIQLCNLTYLGLSPCTAYPEQLLISILSNNRQLNSVTMDTSSTVTDAVVAALGASCPLLRIVMLDECTSITELLPLWKCPELTYLTIKGCTGITPDTLLRLAETPGKRVGVHVKVGDPAEEATKMIVDFNRVHVLPQ